MFVCARVCVCLCVCAYVLVCVRVACVQGTPLEAQEPPSGLDLVRCVATALMPRTVVRLSAGRLNLSMADQVCVCVRVCV